MIDTIAIIEDSRIEQMKMHNAGKSFLLLEEGRKTEASEVSTHCGGGAVNTAVAMARLGCETSTIIKLGEDARGEAILQRLVGEGVSTRWVMRDNRAPTGASVIVSSHDRNAAIFTFRGANCLLEVGNLGDIGSDDGRFDVDLIHISSLSDASADCFPELVFRAKNKNAIVSVNPGVRQLSVRANAFRESLPWIDIVALNRHEADVLVPNLLAGRDPRLPKSRPVEGKGSPFIGRRGLGMEGSEVDLLAFFQEIVGSGPRYILLTDGAGGAFLGMKTEILFCPALPIEVAGTAGGGDAFAATFATLIADGRSPEDALVAATLNAAAVLMVVDTQSGLLYREALEERLAANRDKLKLQRWLI